MDDLISRQAAICAIEEYADRLQMVNWEENPGVPYKAHALNWAINTLRDLPSAERRGRWIIDKEFSNIGRCSFCGDRWGSVDQMNYCPSCGARMECE